MIFVATDEKGPQTLSTSEAYLFSMVCGAQFRALSQELLLRSKRSLCKVPGQLPRALLM